MSSSQRSSQISESVLLRDLRDLRATEGRFLKALKDVQALPKATHLQDKLRRIRDETVESFEPEIEHLIRVVESREGQGLFTTFQWNKLSALRDRIKSRDELYEDVIREMSKPPNGPASSSNAAPHRNVIHSDHYTPIYHGPRSSFSPPLPARNSAYLKRQPSNVEESLRNMDLTLPSRFQSDFQTHQTLVRARINELEKQVKTLASTVQATTAQFPRHPGSLAPNAQPSLTHSDCESQLKQENNKLKNENNELNKERENQLRALQVLDDETKSKSSEITRLRDKITMVEEKVQYMEDKVAKANSLETELQDTKNRIEHIRDSWKQTGILIGYDGESGFESRKRKKDDDEGDDEDDEDGDSGDGDDEDSDDGDEGDNRRGKNPNLKPKDPRRQIPGKVLVGEFYRNLPKKRSKKSKKGDK